LNFDVVLKLGLVWWCLLEVNHGSGMREKIFWITFRWTEVETFIGIESSGEIIAIDNSEISLINIKVESNVEVFPGVELGWVFWEWQLVSLQEIALWDSRVLDLWFEDLNGVVVQEIVDLAFSGSEVFIWVFNNWLNEKGFEYELLSIVLQPLWSDLRNGIVLLISTLRNTSQVGSSSLFHGFE